jgi:hypothetical protein
MARGQSQAAQNQLGITNSVAGNEGTEAQGLENDLIPGYTSLMDTGYLNPEEESAATTSEMGAATAPFQSADFEAKNNAAATRNASDLPAQEDQLALEEGQTAGGAAAKLQQQKMQNQEAGMYGLNELEGGNLTAMEDMYGLGPGTLQARAAGPSGDQLAIGYINAGTQAGSAINTAAKGCWIAAAVYDGWDDPRTIDVRRWLNEEFTKTLHGKLVMAAYLFAGRQVAYFVRRIPLLKRAFKPLFDRALEKARG